MPMEKAIFIDKDGTLIEDVPYNCDPDKIRLCSGVREGLRILKECGYKLIVISNQSGVALGYFVESDLDHVVRKIQSELLSAGVTIDDFYFCYHHPQGVVERYAIGCDCRKPKPGLIFNAARKHFINLNSSWMVGDILNDVEAGNRAGCKTILIDNGNETEWLTGPDRTPRRIVSSFTEAVSFVLQTDHHYVTS
jgi:D-glycero-D-manno-heptose 1,7-bisphosphate phosphatase